MKKIAALVLVAFGLAACDVPVGDVDPNKVIRGKDSIAFQRRDLGDCKIYGVYRYYQNDKGVMMRSEGAVSEMTLCKGRGRSSSHEYRQGKSTQHNHTIFEEEEL